MSIKERSLASSVPSFAGLVVIARSLYPIPSRTRPSKSSAPMVLSLKTWKSRSLPGLLRTDFLLHDDQTKAPRFSAGLFCWPAVRGNGEAQSAIFSRSVVRRFPPSANPLQRSKLSKPKEFAVRTSWSPAWMWHACPLISRSDAAAAACAALRASSRPPAASASSATAGTVKAFARFLDRADVLDPAGGTDIVQMPPCRV